MRLCIFICGRCLGFPCSIKNHLSIILISVHYKATILTPFFIPSVHVRPFVYFPFSRQRLLRQAPVSLDLFAPITLNLPPRHFNWGPLPSLHGCLDNTEVVRRVLMTGGSQNKLLSGAISAA